MKFARLRGLSAALSLAVCLGLCLTATSKADTFSIGVVGTTNQGFFTAGDDFGDYTLQLYQTGSCGSNANTCYANYSALTGKTTYSTTPAPLRTDPAPVAGTGCTVSLPSATSLCNNGHQVLGGFYEGILGVWAQDNGVLQRIWAGTLDAPAILTASGNIFFADGLNENLIVGLASPSVAATPEPNSLALLATGALGLLSMTRRRFSR